jgi:type II secretory pathway component PulF
MPKALELASATRLPQFFTFTTQRIGAVGTQAALRALTDRGVHPIEVVPDDVGAPRGTTLPLADLALTFRVLADLLDAGITITRALVLLEQVVPPRVSAVLPRIAGAVREGQGFASALAHADVRVPAEVAGIIRAGERGSGLAAAVRRAALLCDDGATTRAALRSALAYPTLLAVAGTASLGLLVGVVLPRFASILSDLGQSLPASTRLVLRAGTISRELALPLLFAAVIAALLWRAGTSRREGRRRWQRFLLAVPIVGDLRLGAAGARLCASLSALLASGVPISTAIRNAASATGDEEIIARLGRARSAVEQGSRLSDALGRHAVTSVFVQRLARAGEESGQLASMLAHAGQLERDRVLRRVRSAVRLLEPSMIVAFGGVVALVAAALLQALYSVRPGP